MNKYKKILILGFIAFLSSCFMISCKVTIKNVEHKEDLKKELPIKEDYENYTVDIEYTKYYKNYLITKYYVTDKNNASFNLNKNVYATASPYNFGGVGFGSFTVFSNQPSPNKREIIDRFIITDNNSQDSINVQYSLTGSSLPDKSLKLTENFNLTKEGYTAIDKKFPIDNNINFIITSLGNFEFGSILDFCIENTQSDKLDDTHKNYSIKLVSDNFIKDYPISPMMGFRDSAINKFRKSLNISEDCKYLHFCSCNMLYDTKDVNLKNIKIYLKNNLNNQETLIYSNT